MSKEITRLILTCGALAFIFVLVYHLVYRPYQKKQDIQHCHEWATDEARYGNGLINSDEYKEKFEYCLNSRGQ